MMKRLAVFLLAALAWANIAHAGDFTISGNRAGGRGACELIQGEIKCWVPGFTIGNPNVLIRYLDGLGETNLRGDVRITSTEPNPILDDPDLILQILRDVPANGDVLASVQWQGRDSLLNSTTYAKFSADSPTITDGAETGRMFLDLRTSGTSVPEYVWIGTAFYPFSNDGNSLGRTGNGFSDAYLAEGGIVDWDSGDVTLTQTGNTITWGGLDTMTVGDNVPATITETYATSGTGDVTFDAVNNQITYDTANNTGVSFNLDNSSTLTFFEDDGNGANFKAFVAPASFSGSNTCTFEDDANFIPDSCVGDGSDDDVPEVGDFGALVGGSGIDNNSGTLDFDATEINSLTWSAANGFTSFTFDATGTTNPVFSAGDGTFTLEGITTFQRADAADAGGQIRILEDPGTGSNFIAFAAPAAITSDVTCTLENDGNPIPDSCVGDGVDGGGGLSGGIDNRIVRWDGTSAVQTSQFELDDNGFLQLWGTDADYWLWRAGNDATEISIAGIKTRHASDPFGNGVLSGGDDILTIYAKGNDGNSTENFGYIYFQASSDGSTIGDGDTPGEFIIGTTPDGSATVSERFRVSDAGALGIAGANFGTSNQAFLSGGSSAAPAWTSIIGKKSMWISGGALVANFTNGCAPVDIETGTNDVMFRSCSYDATTQESAQFQIRMPDTWDEGTVTFVPVWSHPSTATNFGVVWDMACLSSSNDDALDTAFGTAQTSTDTGGTTDDVYMGPESSAVTCAGTPAAGDYVTFRVRRAPADGSDTLAVDARLHGVTVYYTESSFVEP